MRLWSLHPEYLDRQGLLALWREGLLALKVLKDQTRGYRNHPQLFRFRASEKPVQAINEFLWNVYNEAVRRGYGFDSTKLAPRTPVNRIAVTQGQVVYEMNHLKLKLRTRDPLKYRNLALVVDPAVNEIFSIVVGSVEPWESVPKNRRYQG